MPTRTSIEQRLADAGRRLNPRRRRLIQSTLENPDETFFLSSRALARRYRVDPATIVRTIQALGYRRYADFLKDLRDHFVQRVTPYRIIESTARERRSVADHVRHSLERDLHNVHAVQSGLDPTRVVDLARRIHRSRSVLVVGVRSGGLALLVPGLRPRGAGFRRRGARRKRRKSRAPRPVSRQPRSADRDQLRTVPAPHGRGRHAGEAPRGSGVRSDRQRHDADRARLRVLPSGADFRLDVHRLLRGAHGGRERDPRRLRAGQAAARARGLPPVREGIPVEPALVRPGAPAAIDLDGPRMSGRSEMSPKDWLARFGERAEQLDGGSRGSRRARKPVGGSGDGLVAGGVDPRPSSRAGRRGPHGGLRERGRRARRRGRRRKAARSFSDTSTRSGRPELCATIRSASKESARPVPGVFDMKAGIAVAMAVLQGSGRDAGAGMRRSFSFPTRKSAAGVARADR